MPIKFVYPNGTTNLLFYTNQWLLSRQEIWPQGSTSGDAITNLFFYTSVSNASNGFVSYGLRSMEVRAAGTSDAATNRYDYDERGYLTRSILQTGTGDPDVIVSNRYSVRGWLEEQLDAAGRKVRLAYDGIGRLQQKKVFEAGATRPLNWEFKHYNENGDVVWTDGPRFAPEDYVWRDHDGGGRQTQEIRWRSRAKSDGTGVEAETGANEFTMHFADYDIFGNQTRMTDSRGNITSNRYDRIGRLLQREWYSNTGILLARANVGYEPGGKVAAHTNAVSGYALFQYNWRGQPVLRRNADGSTNRWIYRADGRLNKETDRNGSYWQRGYDDKNRRITNTFFNVANVPLATDLFEFDRRGNLIRQVDAGGFSFTNRYDGLDRIKIAAGPAIVSITPTNVPSPYGPQTNIVQQVITNFYDAAGVVLTNVNGLGEKLITFRDALNRPTRIEVRSAANALVREVSAGYAVDFHSVTVTNGSGNGAIVSTAFTDNDGKTVLAVGYPAAGVRDSFQWSYDTEGNLLAETHKSSTNGNVITWTTASYDYDGLNRLRTQVDRDGAVTSFSFDAAGNLTNRVVPGGQQWRASYNSANQRLHDFIIGVGGSIARSNSYAYYSATSPWAGLLQARTDGRGVSCNYNYDDWLRYSSNVHTGPLSEHNLATFFNYNVRSILTNITEAFANSTNGPSTAVRFGYDPYGLATAETIIIDGITASTAGQSWDSAGRRTGLGFNGFGYAFGWDAAGALTGSVGVTGGGAYGYDTAGQLQSRTVGSRTTSVLTRDGTGRVLTRDTTIEGTSRLAETLSWTGDGLLATHAQTRSDFTDDRSYFYASQTRWLTEERLNIDGSKRWTNTFVYDKGVAAGPGALTKAGAPTTSAATWMGASDAFARINTETNNVLYQTAYGRMNAYGDSASVTVTVDGQPQQVTGFWTGTSNWPTQWRAVLELTPGAHQLGATARQRNGFYSTNVSQWFTNTASQITRSNTFDAAGQMTQRIWRNPDGTTNRSQTLVWDGQERLLRIVERDSTDSGITWSAVYDAFGRRHRTSEYPTTNGVSLTSQTRTVFSYFDPEVEFLELAAGVSGGVPVWKIYGPDADGSYGGLNGRGGFDAIIPGPELFCPVLSDARGDVKAVYDQDHGALMWNSARSGAYGGVPGHRPRPFGHGPNIVDASTFNGIWMDGTRYYWRGARYYDGESGQWLSFDPFGFSASSNPYGYPNDPINFCDPDGRVATQVTRNWYNGAGQGQVLNTAANWLNNYNTDYNWIGGAAAGVGSILDSLGGMTTPRTYVDGATHFGNTVSTINREDGFLTALSYATTSWNVGSVAEGVLNLDLATGEEVGTWDQRGVRISSGVGATAGIAAGGLGAATKLGIVPRPSVPPVISGGQSIFDAGVNITPRSVANNYRIIGKGGRTFVTEVSAVEKVIGPLKGNRITISQAQARQLENALGLKPGSLEARNIISIVDDIGSRAPGSPLTGNPLFRPGGAGLPGSGRELTISGVPSAGGTGIQQIILEIK